MKRLLTISAVLAVFAGCGTTSPSFVIDFPLNYLMDVDAGESVSHCCFLGGSGDALAASGEALYFIDREAGYVRAQVDLGASISHVASSPDGGYGLALTGSVLRIVSNDTYIQKTPVDLPAHGAFILPKPQSTQVAVLCSDGTALKVSTATWEITGQASTGVQNPTAAAVSADGRYIFAADGQGRVYRVSLVDLSAEMKFQAPGTVTDIWPGPGQELFMTVQDVSQVWVVDVDTGLHSGTFDIPGPAVSVCATGDGMYVYAAATGYGIVVVNTLENIIEAQTGAYGVPVDMAVNTASTRAVIACPATGKLFMLQR